MTWTATSCAQPLEQASLLRLHGPGLGRAAFVVVADQVQEAMDQQAFQLLLKRKARVNSLLHGCRHRYDDVPEHVRLDLVKTSFAKRERKDVGGPVLAPILLVERAHGAIAHKKHAQFGLRKVESPQQFRELRF